MSEPWTPGLAAKVLAAMPAERLAVTTPAAFQTWPTRKPLPAEIGRTLIDAERAARR